MITPGHTLEAFLRYRHYTHEAMAAFEQWAQAAPGSREAEAAHARYDSYADLAYQWETGIIEWLRREAGIDSPLPEYVRETSKPSGKVSD